MKKRGCLSYFLIIGLACFLSLFMVGVLDSELPDMSDSMPDSGDGTIVDPYDTGDDTDPADTTAAPDPADTDIEPPPAELDDTPFAYFYDQLNTDEQHIYDTILADVGNGTKTYHFRDVDYKAYLKYIKRAVTAFTYDHPEYFWVTNGYTTRTSYIPLETLGSIELELSYYLYWDYNSQKRKDKEAAALLQAVEQIAAQAMRYGTTFERIQYVHDYLIENAYYDHDMLDEYYRTNHDAESEYIFSAYGCLVNGRTVCAGYAKAFQLIMNRLGYDCLYVVGDAGGAHGWNCIFIEDEGYYIDITWDDPDYEIDEPKYEYFCINDQALAKTHTVDGDFAIPSCTAEKYNYFRYLDYRLDRYNFDEVSRIISSQSGQHIINIQFATLDALRDAYQALITGGKWSSIPAFSGRKSISHSTNENHYTLTFYLK